MKAQFLAAKKAREATPEGKAEKEARDAKIAAAEAERAEDEGEAVEDQPREPPVDDSNSEASKEESTKEESSNPFESSPETNADMIYKVKQGFLSLGFPPS